MAETPQSRLLRYKREIEADLNGRPRPTRRAVLATRGYLATGRVLGSGRYAKVLEATDYTGGFDDGRVAAKMIDLTKASAHFREKFLPRETAIWSTLRHPHIAYLFDHFRLNRFAVLIVEIFNDGDLLSHLQAAGGVGECHGHTMVEGVFDAIRYLHSRGVVHRDIKLENLLVDGNRLKLSDFGFSRQLQGENDISQTYCGSRLYSSPQILQGKPYRPQLADVWSLGVVTFAVVTGALPFCHVESSGNTALIEAQLRKHYHLPAEVSCEFRALIEWLLTFEEAQRPSMEQICQCDWIRLGPPQCRLKVEEISSSIEDESN